jgi:hypothetical protein
MKNEPSSMQVLLGALASGNAKLIAFAAHMLRYRVCRQAWQELGVKP